MWVGLQIHGPQPSAQVQSRSNFIHPQWVFGDISMLPVLNSGSTIALTAIHIMDNYCAIRLFTTNTSTVKFYWGFHVYRTHLLDYPFLVYGHRLEPPLVCSLTASIFSYFYFLLKYSTPFFNWLGIYMFFFFFSYIHIMLSGFHNYFLI